MEITVKNTGELPAAARTLLPLITAHGGVVAFYGGMGAGKTTLVAALLREMGSADTVTSPTFALVNDYLVPAGAAGSRVDDAAGADGADGAVGSREDGTADVDGVVSSREDGAVGEDSVDGAGGAAGWDHVYHFDFYRIDDLREAFDLGYEEYFYGGGLCLVEWPEKIEQLLPADAMRLRIDVLPDGSRTITIG